MISGNILFSSAETSFNLVDEFCANEMTFFSTYILPRHPGYRNCIALHGALLLPLFTASVAALGSNGTLWFNFNEYGTFTKLSQVRLAWSALRALRVRREIVSPYHPSLSSLSLCIISPPRVQFCLSCQCLVVVMGKRMLFLCSRKWEGLS